MLKRSVLWTVVVGLVITMIASFVITGCKTTTVETTSAAAETTATGETAAAETTATGETAVAESEIKAPEEETTLDLWFQDWAGGQSWMKAYIEAFEAKYPTIKINISFVPFEELNTKLLPAIAAGNEPDLTMLYDEWLLGTDPAQLFNPITPAVYTKEKLGEATFASALSRVTGSDGEIYCAPFCTGSNAAGILIHQDLYDEAGIDPATIKDWNDVKEAAKKLTTLDSSGKITRSGMLFTYTEAANLFLDMICEQGARDKMFNAQTGEWNLNIPEAKNAMTLIQSFVDEKLFDPQSGDPMTSFPNKIGAMLVIGPWALGAWGADQYPDLKLNYISMPYYPGTTKNDHAEAMWACFGVSKRLTGDKLNAAYIWVKEVYENPDMFNIPINNGYWVGIPNSKAYIDSIVKLVEEGNAPNMYAEVAATVASNYGAALNVLPTKITEVDLIRNGIYPEMQNVFLGTKTIDQMLESLTTYLTQKEQEKM
jgi:ABC-type glycerol-3-phosphate transport system substrate-binding protein